MAAALHKSVSNFHFTLHSKKTMVPAVVVALISASLLSSAVHGHMWMAEPLARGSKLNTKYTPVDFDLMAPLGGNGKSFPCGGKPPGPVATTWKAGTSVSVKLDGSAGTPFRVCVQY